MFTADIARTIDVRSCATGTQARPHDAIRSSAARIPGWAGCEGGEEHVVEVHAPEDPLGVWHQCALMRHGVEGEVLHGRAHALVFDVCVKQI